MINMGHTIEIFIDIYSKKVTKILVNGKACKTTTIALGSWVRDEVIVHQGNTVIRIKAFCVGLT